MGLQTKLSDPLFWPIRDTIRACFPDADDCPPPVASWGERLAPLCPVVGFASQAPRSRRAKNPSRDYYRSIIHEGIVPTRDGNWHDFFNMMVWVHFPRTKLLIHKLELEMLESHLDKPGRTNAEDTLSLLDEGGSIALVDPSNFSDDTEVLRREDLEGIGRLGGRVRGLLVGHAVYEHLVEKSGEIFVMAAVVAGGTALSPRELVQTADAELSRRLSTGTLSLVSKEHGRLSLTALRELTPE